MTLRAAAKRLGERVLASPPLLAAGRRALRDRALVLAYHNVVADDARAFGDRSLHLGRAAFAAQLDHLVRAYDVVPLARLAEPSRGGRPRVAITFDDAYRGALTHGFAELAARGLPATVFVAPALLGAGVPWWDALAGADGLAPAVRDAALERFAGEGRRILEWAAAQGLAARHEAPSADHLVATEAELAAAVAAPGFDVGSHTWSHPNLARLDAARVVEELERADHWLRARPLPFVPWLAYPYGLAGAAAREQARALGYAGAFLVEGGWLPKAVPPFAMPRLNVPASLTTRGFALRAARLLSR